MPQAKDILQSLKDNLEREAQFTDKLLSVKIQYCNKLAKATIAQFIEGQWVNFEVMVIPKGVSEPLVFD